VSRGVKRGVAASVFGAVLGTVGTIAALPYLRQIDPLGLSPVILISLMGGFVLGWYVRGKAAAERDATR